MEGTYVKKHIPLSILPRHIEVWKFIDSFIRANGYAPMIREIAESLKMHGPRVHITVNELVNIGSLARAERTKRGLSAVRFPVIPDNLKRES
jgi:hypothetical protein